MSERLPTFKIQPSLGPADGDAAGRWSPQTEGEGGESTVEVVPEIAAAAKDGLQKNDGSHSGDHPPSQTPFAEVSGETVHLAGLGVNPLIFKGTLAGKPVKIMIDSGSAGDFVSQRVVDKLGLDKQTDVSSKVQLADGTQLDLDTSTTRLLLTMGTHLEHTKLSVLPLEGHKVILGRPWLKRWNPTID